MKKEIITDEEPTDVDGSNSSGCFVVLVYMEEGYAEGADTMAGEGGDVGWCDYYACNVSGGRHQFGTVW